MYGHHLIFTVPLMQNPFVHLISVPDDIEVWCIGKEKVKPSSLCMPSGKWKSSPSVPTNLSSSAAMKSNSSCISALKNVSKPCINNIKF